MQAFIILSCLISVSVNFSTFLVIGKTSPVTYQVLGHLKTCLVLAFGYTLLHDPFTERNIIGILVAIFGMGLYSYFCTHENKKKQSSELLNGPQVSLSLSQHLCVYLFLTLFLLSFYFHFLFLMKEVVCLFRLKTRKLHHFWQERTWVIKKKKVLNPKNQQRTLLFN